MLRIIAVLLVVALLFFGNSVDPLTVIRNIALGAIWTGLIFWLWYANSNSEDWLQFVNLFGEVDLEQDVKGGRKLQVFFRVSAEEKFDSHNVMRVTVSEKGLNIRTTFDTRFVKPIFIPDSSLEKIRVERMGLLKRDVYQVKGTEMEIAF